MVINTTNMTEAATVFDTFKEINIASGNAYAIYIMGAVFFIGVLAMVKYDFRKVFVSASFAALSVGVMLAFLEFMGWYLIFYPLTAVIVSLLYYKISGG